MTKTKGGMRWSERIQKELNRDILHSLEEKGPLTIAAIAAEIGLEWRTARKKLFQLANEGKVRIEVLNDHPTHKDRLFYFIKKGTGTGASTHAKKGPRGDGLSSKPEVSHEY